MSGVNCVEDVWPFMIDRQRLKVKVESRCVRLSGLSGCRPVVVRACPVPVSGCPVGRDTTGQPDRPPKK